MCTMNLEIKEYLEQKRKIGIIKDDWRSDALIGDTPEEFEKESRDRALELIGKISPNHKVDCLIFTEDEQMPQRALWDAVLNKDIDLVVAIKEDNALLPEFVIFCRQLNIPVVEINKSSSLQNPDVYASHRPTPLDLDFFKTIEDRGIVRITGIGHCSFGEEDDYGEPYYHGGYYMEVYVGANVSHIEIPPDSFEALMSALSGNVVLTDEE